ncbi:MAG: PEP-utilizing enzyme [Anaerolineae bacterium]
MHVPAPDQSGYFTTRLPADDYLWTAGFFNERFPDVVSPLGWSVVRRLVECTAFREPLSFIGYRLPDDFPLTKLYRGHVYANVGVFQRLYRVFPQALVPQGAGRYFPNADTSLRYAVSMPNPVRFLQSVVRTLVSEPGWHPFNYVVWDRFVPRFDQQVADCVRQIEADGRPPALLQQVERLMDASLDLLRLHRWSLTYADILYELLQRLLSAWVDAGDARQSEIRNPKFEIRNLKSEIRNPKAELISGLPNKSTETDVSLWRLAERAAGLDAIALDHLRAGHFDAFLDGLDKTPAGRRFQQAFGDFLARYGHRSPSLDLWYPAYADEPTGVLALVVCLLDDASEGPAAREHAQEQRRLSAVRRVGERLGDFPIRWWTFRMLLWLTQRYTLLREDQRFYWQKSMHAKRRAFLRIGRALAAEGVLATDDDIFFLTLSEISGVVRGWLKVTELRDLIADRRTQFAELQGTAYPAFLEGQSPLCGVGSTGEEAPQELSGLAASPGRVRGPALVVSGPSALNDAWQRASSDSILVTGSTDPAWTPLFLRVGGLVMERGGQLSHGAVVAREYGLPAVVGVAGALDRISDGRLIEVDGGAGTVTLLQT